MNKNKWIIKIETKISFGDKEILIPRSVVVPPTSGDRTDIIGESGKYYCNMSRDKFFEREPKANEFVDFTPRKIKDDIFLIIEIKKGEITIKEK